MRKHFLILMLMALLPLVGWAATNPIPDGTFVNLAGYHIELSAEAATYTGGNLAPTVSITNGTNTYDSGFNVVWSPASPKDFVSGGYTVTVTADDVHTFGVLPTNTAEFYVMKAQAAETTPGVLASGTTYDGNPYTLVTTAPVVNIGTIEYSIDNKATWSTALPTATLVGTYTVWYRVASSNNIVGFEKNMGTVAINGNTIPSGAITAPTVAGALNFQWSNGAKVAQPLITTLGSVSIYPTTSRAYGTMKYRAKKSTTTTWGAWTTTAPTGDDAATYNLQYMVEGDTGFNDIAATDLANVTISPITPATVTAPTGKTGLVYAGDGDPNQTLLSAAGSASDGASVKYQVRYKADVTTAWGSEAYDPAVANIADVKGGNAGAYQIKTIVETAGNYITNESAPIEVIIAKAPAFITPPTAADLTWNNANQQLVVEGTGHVLTKVLYTKDNGTTWSNDITTIVGKDAADYTVKYKVTDPNYIAVPETTIENVKIKKKSISVKVNDITKVFDNTTGLTTATVDGGLAPFTFITPLATANDFASLTTANYVAVSQKNAGSYNNAVTVALTTLEAINTAKGYFYEYTIVPGKLTIEKRPIYVEAKTGLNIKYGNNPSISKEYTIKNAFNSSTATSTADIAGNAASNIISAIFTTAPVLTTTAATTLPEVGTYPVSFTAGVTANNYKMDLTRGENLDGYVIGTANFVVNPDPEKKVIITVLPHTQKYTGVAESWANMQEGVDYVVNGLISGDELAVKPTFTRSEADKFDVKYDALNNIIGYDLTASGAVVSDASKYPGGIVYNNSTFTIEPAPLAATVTQQTIYEIGTGAALPYADAWSVEGLQNGETKADLGGTLAINTSVGSATDYATTSTEGLYPMGIELTITNPNYELAGTNVTGGKAYGALRVITAATFELDPTDANLAQKIVEAADYCKGTDGIAGTADDQAYTVTFAHKTLKADTWYTMVLPFSVKAAELVNTIKDAAGDPVFTITNRLNEATTTGNIVFKLEMKEIPANEPFLIKTAEDVDLQDFKLTARTIVNGMPLSPVYDGNKLIGTYENIEIQCATGNVLKWLVNEDTPKPADPTQNYDVNNWKICRDYKAPINAMEAYLFENRTVAAALAHPTIITVEDFDGQTTSIKTLNAETMKAYNAEGWYTVNGIKLQSAPTEKGVYINNGKKVVVK